MRTRQGLLAAVWIAAAACGGSTGNTSGGQRGGDQLETGGDFALEIRPATLAVGAGQTAFVLVNLARSGGSAEPVTLTVSGLPAGASVSPVTIPASLSTGVLVLSAGAAASARSIVVTAASASRSHQGSFQLTVGAAATGGANPTLAARVLLTVGGFSNPSGVAVNPSTGEVHVVNDQGGGMAVYDPPTNTMSVLPVPSSHHVAVNPTTGTVYAVGATARLAIVKGSTVSQLYVGGALQGVAVDSATNQVFVGENLNHTVYQIDGATEQVQSRSWRFSSAADGPVKGPVAVDPVRHLVYASLYGGVGVINPANGDSVIVDIQRVNSSLTQVPVDLAVHPVTGSLFILGSDGFNGSDGWIHLLDDTYLPSSTTMTATNAPSSVAVDPVTNRLYVADARNHSVNVLDLDTRTFLSQVTIPPSGGIDEGPIGLAVDPTTHQVFATFRYYDASPMLAIIDGS